MRDVVMIVGGLAVGVAILCALYRVAAWLLTLNRDRLYRHLARGLWFPCFVKRIDELHERVSINRRIIRRVKGKRPRGPAGISEGYLLISVIAGFLWLSLVNAPLLPGLDSLFGRTVGSVIAGYFIFEFGVFLAHWLIVARGFLWNLRRSFVCFILNIPEMAIFFGILLNLWSCYKHPMSAWDTLIVNSRSLLSVIIDGGVHSVERVSGSVKCDVFSHSQATMGTFLVIIIILNLAASIIRPDLNTARRN